MTQDLYNSWKANFDKANRSKKNNNSHIVQHSDDISHSRPSGEQRARIMTTLIRDSQRNLDGIVATARTANVNLSGIQSNINTITNSIRQANSQIEMYRSIEAGGGGPRADQALRTAETTMEQVDKRIKDLHVTVNRLVARAVREARTQAAEARTNRHNR